MMAGMTARQDAIRYSVRLSVPQRCDWCAWRAVSDDFENGLARQESATVAKPHVELKSRRGRLRRMLAVATVIAADVAEPRRLISRGRSSAGRQALTPKAGTWLPPWRRSAPKTSAVGHVRVLARQTSGHYFLARSYC